MNPNSLANSKSYLQRFENWLDAPPSRASHVDDDGKAERPCGFRRNAGQIREDSRCFVGLQTFELRLGRKLQQGTTTPIPGELKIANAFGDIKRINLMLNQELLQFYLILN